MKLIDVSEQPSVARARQIGSELTHMAGHMSNRKLTESPF